MVEPSPAVLVLCEVDAAGLELEFVLVATDAVDGTEFGEDVDDEVLDEIGVILVIISVVSSSIVVVTLDIVEATKVKSQGFWLDNCRMAIV